MANIPIRDIPGAVVASPDPSNLIPMDNGSLMQKTTIANAVNETLPLSSQAEAEAGVDNAKRMSPLRTKQAIDAQTPLIVNTAITALNLGTMSQEESSDYTPTSGLAAVALSNDYNDLDSLPTLGSAAATNASDYATAAQGSLADTAVQPGDAELVPSGGTIGQVLVKNSGTNYDTGWVSSASATAVSYAPQTLTDAQQEQARENIGIDDLPWLSNLNFYSTLSLELAEDRGWGPVVTGPDGNGIFDGFNTIGFVDVFGSSNLDTSIPGQLRPEVGVQNAVGPLTMTNTTADWDGYTMRERFSSAIIAAEGDRVRLTLVGPATGPSLVVNGMYIGNAATSGNPYSFAASPVPVTVGGMTSFTIPTGQTVISDWISFVVDDANSLVVSYYVVSGSIAFVAGTSPNYASYNIEGNNAAAVVATNGYHEAATFDIGTVSRIEVPDEEYADLLVASVPLETPVVPEWGKVIAFVRPNGAEINTDIIFSLSRDGADFGPCTMTAQYDRPGGSVVLDSGVVDVSGLDSGTECRWRIVTNNGAGPDILAVGVIFGVDV